MLKEFVLISFIKPDVRKTLNTVKASAKRSISCTKFQQQPKLLLAKSFYSNSKRFRPFPLGPRRRSITCLTHSEKKTK